MFFYLMNNFLFKKVKRFIRIAGNDSLDVLTNSKL